MRSFLVTAKDLLFPPRCAGCGRTLPPALGKETPRAFCAECDEEWEREMRFSCPQCGLSYCDCRCLPSVMKRAGVAAYIKLCPYGEGKDHRVAHRVIWEIKRSPSPRALARAAEDLAPAVLRELDRLGAPADKTVITWLPRSRAKRRRTGVDQAEGLARALSRQTGLVLCPLLVRARRTKEQKRLNAKMRAENLKNAFSLARPVPAPFVILVDDLVTTGVGMSVAAKVLRAGGAEEVLAASIAYTERKTQNFR